MNTRLTRRPSCQRSHSRNARGLTLVESLAALATVAVALSSTLPGLKEVRLKKLLESTAAQLKTDVNHARSLAVSQGAPVRLAVHQVTDGACYVIHTGSAGDCSCNVQGTAQCRPGGAALHTVSIPGQQSLRLTSNSASMIFDGHRGTVTPTGSLSLTTADGRSLRVVVNIMGRARTCSPGSTVRGYATC